MTKPFTVELWTDLQCAGGVAIGSLRLLEGGRVTDAITDTDQVEITVVNDARVPVALRDVVRLTAFDGTVRERRVQRIGRDPDSGTTKVTAVSPLLDLAASGLLSTTTGGVAQYDTGGRYTATEWATIVRDDLIAKGITWWALGTISITGYWDLVAPATGWTHLEWLRQLQAQTGAELRARRNGSTNYLLDLVPQIGAGATPVRVAHGKNLLAYQLDEDDAELASAITVLGGVPEGSSTPVGIGENAWTVGTVPGGAPFWVPLTDPAGNAAPIAFDGQFGTGAGQQPAHLLLSDATTLQILDSRASDSAVRVSATTGLVAGHHVQLVSDSAGTRLTELRRPGTKRLHRVDTVEDTNAGRNLLRNGLFLDWSSVSAPALWTAQGGTFTVGEYPRAEPATYSSIVVHGNQSAGAGSIVLRGFAAGARLYLRETITVGGNTYRCGNAVAVANGSGEMSIVLLTGTLLANITDGQAVTLFSLDPKRPGAFPVERDTNNILRMLSNGAGVLPPSASALRFQSETFRVKYLAGPLAQVNAMAAFTLHNGTGADIGNTDAGAAITDDLSLATGRNLPGLMIRNNGAGTRLAWSAVAQRVPAGATLHATAICSTTLSADTTLDLCLLSGAEALWQGCRWVTMWLGTATTLAPYPGSWDNTRWQRGNRALAARALSSRQLRVSLVDLSAAAGYSITREQLVLGGPIPLDDLGIAVRLMGLSISTDDPRDVDVILDSRPTRLTQFLAERL